MKGVNTLILHLKEFIKSIAAGAAIAIGTSIYLALGGWIGAVFFAIGLYLILWFKFNLYTGKVGYIKSIKDTPNLFAIFIGNLIGCCLIFILLPSAAAATIVATKLSISLWLVLIKAIICGILIYAAVEQYKQGKEYAPALAVPAFILCGAEHSIADLCFLMAAGVFNLEAIIFILVVAIGNGIGSLLTRMVAT
jgi:formate/nitrite transporter FocA (FNT family)